jgi:hypothetical protein
MHEMIHQLGLSDDPLGATLYSVDPLFISKPDASGHFNGTTQFSAEFRRDCFSNQAGIQ